MSRRSVHGPATVPATAPFPGCPGDSLESLFIDRRLGNRHTRRRAVRLLREATTALLRKPKQVYKQRKTK